MSKLITVFKTGTHTDRYGNTREYSEKDVQDYIDNSPDSIPIQFTHDDGTPAGAEVVRKSLFIEKAVDPSDGKLKSFVKGVISGAVDKVKSLADSTGMKQISSAIDLTKKQFIHFALVNNGAIDLPAVFSNEKLTVLSMPATIESEDKMYEKISQKLDELKAMFSKNKPEGDEMDKNEVQKLIDDNAKAQKAEFEKQQNAANAEFEKQKKEMTDKIAALEKEKDDLKKAEFQKQQDTLRAEFTAFVKKLVEDKKIFKADEAKTIEIGMKLSTAGEVQFSKDEKPVSAFEAYKDQLSKSKTGFETELAKGEDAKNKAEFQLPDGVKKEDMTEEAYNMYMEEMKKKNAAKK